MAMNNAIRLLSFGLSVALAASVCNGQTAPAAPGDTQGRDATAAAWPPTAAEMPPSQPKVTCKGGQLAISARNSTLESVLEAVRSCLGVKIDVPEGSASKRFYDELGPGPARQVLESLLDASEFNYVIGSSNSDPQKVETVLLLLRAGEKSETITTASASADIPMTSNRRGWLQTRQATQLSRTGPDEDSQTTPENVPAPAVNEAIPVRPDSAQSIGASQASAPSTAATTPAPQEIAPPTPPEPSTTAPPIRETEDKITSMQQMFEQRRQMVENQNAAQSGASPKQ
jgi:hypothetical protein